MRRHLTCLTLILATAACASVSRDYPEKSMYAFDVDRPTREAAPVDAPVVLVRRFRTSALGGGRQLVYRTGDSRFESDYYTEFFDEPEGLLTGVVSNWVADAGLATVVSSAGDLEPDFVLHGAIRGLYVDVREEDPLAVVDLQLVLSRRDGGYTVPIWRSDQRRFETAAGPSGGAVLVAWNRAMRSILTEVEPELREALAGESARATAP